MDALSKKFYETLLNKDLWQRTYERIVVAEKFTTDTIEKIFQHIESPTLQEKLAKSIAMGTYTFSVPRKISIAKDGTTKKRVVYSYAEFDRFVISLLYRAMSIIYAERISERCYSYKMGVSTYDAVREIQAVKRNKSVYGVKMDIHAYFNSVNKAFLYACIDELFPEQTGIRKTVEQLYCVDTVSVNGKEVEEYKALIPGAATGSFWANYCLHEVDEHFEALNLLYARYSDDIILFAETREEIDEHIAWILEYIGKLGLTINPDKYTYFSPDEPCEYLGLRFTNSTTDISTHAKQKVKRTFKRWCKKARVRIEKEGKSFRTEAILVCKRFNYRLYRSFILDTTKYGWAYYAFRYINTIESLKELDTYCKDTLRALKTGKHTKGNKYALTEEDIQELGFVSFVDMYNLFKADFGYYCDVVARL